MKRFVIISSLFLLCISGLNTHAYTQDGMAPGTVAALARKTSSSEMQNWYFAIGAMVSATAGILLVSWDPGAGAQNH